MMCGVKKTRCDWGNWLKQFGNAKDYYFAEMSVYVAHGVLFKDFHSRGKMSSKGSGNFTYKIVEPAFYKTLDVFGVKPVIHQFTYQDGFEIFDKWRYVNKT